jgi:macrolide transport system ATP-binding/permease protein
MKKTPKRMGNSEARLHKMHSNGKKKKLDKVARAYESRLEQLEAKERPREIQRIKIDIQEGSRLYSKVAIRGRKVTKSFGSTKLLSDIDFDIPGGRKTAIIGDNGCGKTTLISMILSRENGICVSEGVKAGYFSQSLDILDDNRAVIENVLKKSLYPEEFARIILARLLFRGDDVYKKAGLLSGGEKVKASFAKVLLGDSNLLILDEPTNYLDIYSQEALEEVLKDYEGTLLFVSHDRRFIGEIADYVVAIENGRAVSFDGSFREYEKWKNTKPDKEAEDVKGKLMLLENRLAAVMGRLSFPGKKDDIKALDDEFKTLSTEIRRLKSLIK